MNVRQSCRPSAAAFSVALLLFGSLVLWPSGAVLAQGEAQPESEQRSRAKPMEKIVVTATRREELAQRVPVAVSAFSGDLMRETRVGNLDDLSALVPGPSFIPISGASQAIVQIRGTIGGSDDSPAFDTPVALFLDELYYGSVSNFYPDFFDASQVAVLRGPQGTSFGRNVVGGAIQITSNRPEFENSAQFAGTLMNRPGFESEGYYNGMISDKFATRIAYSVKNIDGYNRNVVTGNDLDDKKMFAVRWSNRITPSDDLDINLIASWTHEDSNGPGFRYLGDGFRVAEINALPEFRQVLQDTDGYVKKDMWSVVLHVEWDTSIGTVTSITGYRGLDQAFEKDEDGYSFPFNQDKIDTSKEDQFSQELRLTSPSDGRSFEWLAGIYYLHQKLFRSERHGFGGPPGSLIAFLLSGAAGLENGARQFTEQYQTSIVDSIAVYAEGNLHISDWLGIRAGVRYTYDHKKGETVHTEPSRFFGDPFAFDWSDSWDKVTPRVPIELTPNDDMLFYASATSGFKSGGFTFSSPTLVEAMIPLLPESAWSYEVGAKLAFFEEALRVNLVGFLMDTKNLQVRALEAGVLTQSNAGKTRNKGFEIELVANPVGEFFVGVNYNYIHARYVSFPGCTAALDCTGNIVPFTPKQTLGLFLQNTFDIGNAGALTLRGEYKYMAPYYFGPQNTETPQVRELTKRDTFINVFLTYEPNDSAWSLQFWARNIANDKAVTFAPNYFFFMLDFDEFLGGANQAWRLSYTEPRSYGVTFTYRFN